MSNIRHFIDLNHLHTLTSAWAAAEDAVRYAEEELAMAESDMYNGPDDTQHEAEYTYHAACAYLEGCEDERQDMADAVYDYLQSAA